MRSDQEREDLKAAIEIVEDMWYYREDQGDHCCSGCGSVAKRIEDRVHNKYCERVALVARLRAMLIT